MPSAIGIVRISGCDTKKIIRKVFVPKYGKLQPRRATLGYLLNTAGEHLDEVLCVTMDAPNSYTGEDTAELYCHGSVGVLEGALKSVYAAGARPAKAGEFTKRAFLNGRMDLSQAEAVVEIIESESEAEAVNAASQLGGTFGEKIRDLRYKLIKTASHFFALIDYPDEEIPEFEGSEAQATLEEAERELKKLCSTYERGSLLREGIPCAIAGCVNAGKSSLLNALAGFERSIVTDIPGTTRDIVEQRIKLGGVMLRVQDTAGLRGASDTVEKIGIELAKKSIKESKVLILVFDNSRELNEDDIALINDNRENNNAICVVNKCDLERKLDISVLKNAYNKVFEISAKTLDGIDELTREIESIVKPKDRETNLVTNPRYIKCMTDALDSIVRAKNGCIFGTGFDAVTFDVENAAHALGEIIGAETSAEIVDDIFSRFCVGK